MELKTGMRVRLKNHPSGVTGTITRVVHQGLWSVGIDKEYLVKYDGDGYIPPEDWHKAEHLDPLDLLLPTSINELLDNIKKCTCGTDSIFPNADISFHSDYCDLREVGKNE